MQVANKALKITPQFIMQSVDSVKQLLDSIKQLTDPPLDLNGVLERTNFLRRTPACHVQRAQWLRTHLQLSEKDLRRCLSKSGVLARSPVGTSITTRAQLTFPQPVCCSGSFCSSAWRMRFISGSLVSGAAVRALSSDSSQELWG